MKKTLIATALFAAVSTTASAAGRDQIEIVGSSTVYPFATVVAEKFGNSTDFKTPKIESTGSGGGMKLFCKGAGIETPDITNASRRIKKTEFDTCQKNGVKEITEVLIGYDGIVLANSKATEQLSLSRKDIFLALAKKVPGEKDGELVANPYKTWKDVNSALPANKIEVLGPPPTSGTRDAFAELALEGGCKTFDWIKQIKADSKAAKKAGDKAKAKELKSKYKGICHTIREDGAYIEAGENDNLIVQKLEKNPAAIGVFGFSYLDQNADKIQGSIIDGKAPEFESIASGDYEVSRPLYFYIKKAHIGQVPGMTEYAAAFTADAAFGDEGYLLDKGLIPLDAEKRAATQADVKALKNLEM